MADGVSSPPHESGGKVSRRYRLRSGMRSPTLACLSTRSPGFYYSTIDSLPYLGPAPQGMVPLFRPQGGTRRWDSCPPLSCMMRTEIFSFFISDKLVRSLFHRPWVMRWTQGGKPYSGPRGQPKTCPYNGSKKASQAFYGLYTLRPGS